MSTVPRAARGRLPAGQSSALRGRGLQVPPYPFSSWHSQYMALGNHLRHGSLTRLPTAEYTHRTLDAALPACYANCTSCA
jgi:hypothetical protein